MKKLLLESLKACEKFGLTVLLEKPSVKERKMFSQSFADTKKDGEI